MCVCLCMCMHVLLYHSAVANTFFYCDRQIKDRLPELKAIIQYMPERLDVAQREAGVMAWDEFLHVGKVCLLLLCFL